MTKQYVLGVDHGSGGCKVTCMDDGGQVVSEANVSYRSYYPKPQWVEQEPEEWIDAAVEAIRRALQAFTADERRRVKAISFSAPHHVAVLLDSSHKVLRRVIMWNDQRSGEEANYFSAFCGDQIYGITHNSPSPTWTLCHMAWLQKHEPEVYGAIHKIVFMKDYVRYRFNGILATDYIEAEGTLFYDIHNKQWSEPLYSLVSLDESMLPPVLAPTDVSGALMPQMAERIGLPAGIPIVVGTADTAAEIFGCGTVEAGDGVVKLATAGNFSVLAKQPVNNKKMTSYHHPVPDLYYQNSATNFAAASFRWFKESFLKELEQRNSAEQIYRVIDAHIEQIPAGSEGLLFQPYLNGERSPHWDPDLRASFFGCTVRHQWPHFARAILEGVGFSIRDAALEFSVRPDKVKIIGGGSKGKVWVQIMADILHAEMEIPKVSDASYGGCLIAATAIGWFSGLKEAALAAQTVVDRVEPRRDNVSVYDEMFEIYRELHAQTKHLSHRLTAMSNAAANRS